MMTVSSRTIAHKDVAQQIHGVHAVQATPYSMCSKLETTRVKLQQQAATLLLLAMVVQASSALCVKKRNW